MSFIARLSPARTPSTQHIADNATNENAQPNNFSGHTVMPINANPSCLSISPLSERQTSDRQAGKSRRFNLTPSPTSNVVSQLFNETTTTTTTTTSVRRLNRGLAYEENAPLAPPTSKAARIMTPEEREAERIRDIIRNQAPEQLNSDYDELAAIMREKFHHPESTREEFVKAFEDLKRLFLTGWEWSFIPKKVKSVTIGGISCPIEKISTGQLATSHDVFRFTEEREVTLNGQMWNTRDLIVKQPKIDSRDPHRDIVVNDIVAYEVLAEAGIPQPRCLVSFRNSLERGNSHCSGISVFEKMEKSVSCDAWDIKLNPNATFDALDAHSKKLLRFIEELLYRSFQNPKMLDIPADLYPRNVMSNGGEFFVVDPELPRNSQKNFMRYILAWSAGNRSVLDFLASRLPESATEKFPRGHKQEFYRELEAYMTSKNTLELPRSYNEVLDASFKPEPNTSGPDSSSQDQDLQDAI